MSHNNNNNADTHAQNISKEVVIMMEDDIRID